MKTLVARILFAALLWEGVAVLAPAGARMPHVWRMAETVGSFARFSDRNGPPLLLGGEVLGGAALTSLLRAGGGFVFGLAGGYLLGAGALLLPGWQAVTIRATACVRAVPPLSLIFLLTFLSPGANVATVAYVAVCLALLLAGGLHETHRYLSQPLLYQVANLGGSRWRQVRDVALPGLWFQARRISLWACSLLMPFTFGAELINSRSGGLGTLGYQAFLYANLAQLMLLAGIYLLLGHLLTAAIRHGLSPTPQTHFVNT